MENKYILDSESEDETSDAELDSIKASISTDGWKLQDIEQLKKQTSILLDATWKFQRNRHLIVKLLDLEQPVITAKMVDFLLQDNVCETLISFITQNSSENVERTLSNEQNGVEMKLAYRAVLLLSPEIITEPLNALLTRKASIVASQILNIFLDTSNGSFYHAYRLFECLLRCYPSETFDGLSSEGLLFDRFRRILRYIGFPPVCELLVMLVAFTPISRSSQLFIASEKSRWSFLEELNKWNLLLNLTRAVVRPSDFCRCTSDVNEDQHSTAACQLFQDLVEKISLEDTGDLLLLPLGQDSVIIDLLVDTVVDYSVASGIRRSAGKILCFLLRRSAESEIVCFVTTSPNVPPTTTYLPNRLFALREKIVSSVKNRIAHITQALLDYDEQLSPSLPSIRYSSYEVKKPFGTLRLLMVEVLVLTVESDETVAGEISLELWKSLISWTLKYANNNISHALFYRLIFAVLRQGQEAPQKILFQKAKFASFLAENFLPYQHSEGNSEAVSKELSRKRQAIKGLIMNCANAIRLQVSTQAPNTFLANFLSNHAKWNEFIAELTIATDLQLKFGMGIKVTVIDAKSVNPQQNSMMMFISEAKPVVGSEEMIDHSTRFAKSLGFFEDAQWSLNSPAASANAIKDVEDAIQFEELSSQDKRKYLEDSGRLSYLGDED